MSVRHSDAPGPDDLAEYDPRPGYRAPQNPILAAFREQTEQQKFEGGFCGHGIEAAYWLQYGEDDPEVWAPYAPEHIKHARRVLTRLAALS